MTEKFRSEYSPAETQMIICLTRGRECTPEKCLKCGWLRDEVKESLNKGQEQWIIKGANNEYKG